MGGGLAQRRMSPMTEWLYSDDRLLEQLAAWREAGRKAAGSFSMTTSCN